jgi:hypothetical protein
MRVSDLITLSIVITATEGASTFSSVQEKTGAEVRQQSITTKNNVLDLVTDASYPELAVVLQAQADQAPHLKEANDRATFSAATSASSESETSAAVTCPLR